MEMFPGLSAPQACNREQKRDMVGVRATLLISLLFLKCSIITPPEFPNSTFCPILQLYKGTSFHSVINSMKNTPSHRSVLEAGLLLEG